ncbi:PucR family transcriptional regulator [Virgibacillus sediminis]|uniref:PucR family transcriptional regulator n=1 Tax=Virgibacillus sediminis TaxID=202260 RepID=A0ABV7A4L4_9BACI
MLDQLRRIFPSLLMYQETVDLPADGFQWFLTKDHDVIGIASEELTERDMSLLAAFLTPYDIKFPMMTEAERKWKNRIDHPTAANKSISYRFVYFFIQKNQLDPHLFREAIHEAFARPIPIIWKNKHEGILIEEEPSPAEDPISYEQIIHVLMSDLYVKINFFLGPYVENPVHARDYYEFLVEYAPTAISYSDVPVITFTDSIPLLFIHQADSVFLQQFPEMILKEFAGDKEMLATVRTYIQSNMNISVAAKELFMHRNSLQYRLDKFISRTGIDIRQFRQAVTVYLALLARD